ncbi:UDP-glycosyltransferase 71K2-like [Vicia villosa]|uniref:UDP-glycosyltransferase 71K2-like n=1 Tax=Vicia villosa TaxID=3911 RepID=UPI00273CA5CA|nr:UDP-glycosyltransferase 71K2-like [Vicia villosa]
MKKKSELIFLPSPGIGHLASTLEFAKLLIKTNNTLSITVLWINLLNTPISDSYIKSVLNSQPQIHLIHLPQVESPPKELLISPPCYIQSLMHNLTPHVKSTILSSHSNHVVALVLDIFLLGFNCNWAFSFIIHYGENYRDSRKREKKYNADDLTNSGDNSGGNSGIFSGKSFEDISVNNSDDSSDKDSDVISKKVFGVTSGDFPDSGHSPDVFSDNSNNNNNNKPLYHPIYAIGPLLDLKVKPNPNLDQSQHDLILKWLDKQPYQSVVFLCFGSMGVSFGTSQIREIALGLKNSGMRFLWSIKSPPEGFLDWMKLEGKGMTCEWAPQVEILGHKAIGGFVSHCGWNSILESLWFGVPILTWPIYAEQQLNAFRMVKELELSVELRVDYRIGSKDVVMAEEIEKGLKNLMDRDNIVHKKVQEMKEIARNVVVNGGSSFISVEILVNNMIGSN